ncbi:MAG: hypothetical protein RLZZ471_42 [Actinomycetota bacterium]|jgi:CobQ-like glutamine amidotransferase family enzyme
MIKILQVFPDHLDLNGDGGNALVLAKRANWGGLAAAVSSLQPGQTPRERPDLVVIGHGSSAAWKQIYVEFSRLVPLFDQWMKSGTHVVAISSGYAALHGLLPGLDTPVVRTERKSVFVVEEFEGEQIYGYLNSDLSLPIIHRHGNLLGSMLHGPLLTKNSWLADQLIESIRGKVARSEISVQKLDQIELLADAARKLAAEQASS